VIYDGIFSIGRFSVGWNFHRTRQVKTIALPLAIAFVDDRFLVMIGPITFIWLRD
jgi:hypothetical protein